MSKKSMQRQMDFFFFSSRRRHTRFDCDWSSDVCSSDLRTDDGDAGGAGAHQGGSVGRGDAADREDRKSTRLNSSHSQISYAVFCLKKKKIACDTILYHFKS